MTYLAVTMSSSAGAARATVTAVGEIDCDSEPQLRAALSTCLEHAPAQISLDLGGVVFCECRGLNTLLWARRQAQATGVELVLDGIRSAAVDRIFELLGLEPLPSRQTEPGRAVLS